MLIVGMKVRYALQIEWGVGHLLEVHEEDAKAHVLFPARAEGSVWVSTRGGRLEPVALAPGTGVQTAKGIQGTVESEVEGGRGLRRYEVRLSDGALNEYPESALYAVPPKPDLLSLLKEGRVADARAFVERRALLELDDERRCDAIGALVSSRVMVKPHQVGVVQRVLSSRAPRFILADEVGLGKTIEAGMVFSALKLAGLAQRVLVVAPSHLTVQWLVELFHKFNTLFTFMDTDRYQSSLEEVPDVSPWARFPFVVTSLEMLQRSEEYRAQTSAADAPWDLVIIDEAHHLRSKNAFAAAEGLAQNSWGLLLLTATPMQLDPEEYHALLRLIEPKTAPSLEAFTERLRRQEEVSKLVRQLLSGKKSSTARDTLASLFPDDASLKTLEGEALVAHLAETYSLSNRLLRNRRAVVGGFAKRVLHRHAVALSKDDIAARDAALAELRDVGALKGAALANVVRKLESSSGRRDAKFTTFAKLLHSIWAKESAAKVLVFTESRDTLDSLKSWLVDERVEALAYHGDLPLIERDRQVARFRDPEGPKVLICTEVGGEGRNFQFAHHLVHYDLPWSPSVVEQRIGRLDRIGQNSDVQIHVFDVKNTLSQDLLNLLDEAVGVFGETIGGLDAVLEEVEPKFTALALAPPKERAAYVKALGAAVANARAQVRQAYDPLLDIRSADEAAVLGLLRRAQVRADIDSDDDETLDEGLWAVARDLDERLEECLTEVAARIGVGVDTDQQVDAFQCAFSFGHALNVEALPGFDIARERTMLGSFWRDTAVEQEENEFFATGHPLVEALFGFVRDGPYGRNGARFIDSKRPVQAKGLEFVFHVSPPQAAELSQGARVPSRQLSRFIEGSLVHVAVAMNEDGRPRVKDDLLKDLKRGGGRSLRGNELDAVFPELSEFVDAAVAEGTKAAEAVMVHRLGLAKTRIEQERDAALKRLKLAFAHQGLKPEAAQGEIDAEVAHYQELLGTLARCRVELDSACAFVINR